MSNNCDHQWVLRDPNIIIGVDKDETEKWQAHQCSFCLRVKYVKVGTQNRYTGETHLLDGSIQMNELEDFRNEPNT